MVEENKEDLQQQLDNLKKELETNSKDDKKVASLLLERAKLYKDLKDIEKAYQDIKIALQRDPSLEEQGQELLKSLNGTTTSKSQPEKEDPRVDIFQHHLSELASVESVRPFIRSPDFVSVLTACGTPDTPHRVKSLGFMILTRLFNPEKPENFPLQAVIEQCAASFTFCLDQGKNDSKLLAYRTLLAIFQTSMTIGAAILCQEGTMDNIMDTIEFEIVPVQIAITEVLTIASSDKTCRQQMMSYTVDWLVKTVANSKTDPQLKSIASTALTKLKAQPKEGEGVDVLKEAMDRLRVSNSSLVGSLKDLIKTKATDPTIILNAIEGLAYSSLEPAVKEDLGSDSDFLKSLSTLAVNTAREETSHTNPLLFGTGTIFANLTMYRPILDEQQRQMKKLRDLANQQKKTTEPEDPRDDDSHVEARIKRAVANGISVALMVLAKSKSINIRTVAAQAYLNIVTPQSTRGQLLQQGVVKALLPISREPDPTGLLASQALAKLAITTDPRMAFQADTILDLVRPFLKLCQDPKSQLRQFEGLMALTNLASVDDRVRLLIENAKGMTVVEQLQLSDNTMVQRAATELICNMTFCEPIFELYSNSKQRLRLLLILSDHEDDATRRAASGALAILCNSPDSCRLLLEVDQAYQRLARLLVLEETPDVQHRAVEIVRCLVDHEKKKVVEGLVKEEVDQKLIVLVKSSNVPTVRQAAMEVLKMFVENGVQLKA